jgi:hypothetical protein
VREYIKRPVWTWGAATTLTEWALATTYPYSTESQHLTDKSTFARFPWPFTCKEDRRRHNVDQLIRMISDSIRGITFYVKFGTSPSMIWQNGSDVPLSSAVKAGGTGSLCSGSTQMCHFLFKLHKSYKREKEAINHGFTEKDNITPPQESAKVQSQKSPV